MVIRRIVLAIWLASSRMALAIGCRAEDNAPRMEQVVQSYVSSKKFMGSVLVARDGTVLLDKGYGFANLEWNVPNSPTTKFRLGSVTKQFTAASTLLLQERGKLPLFAESEAKFFPKAIDAEIEFFKDDKGAVTHLVLHQGAAEIKALRK